MIPSVLIIIGTIFILIFRNSSNSRVKSTYFSPVFFRLYYLFSWHDHIYDLEHSLLFLHEYFTRSSCLGVVVGLDSTILQCFTLNRLESFRFVLIPWNARIWHLYNFQCIIVSIIPVHIILVSIITVLIIIVPKIIVPKIIVPKSILLTFQISN